VKHAVATSGTAMTEGHLKILSKLTSDIRLAYDGDAAGVNATERAIMLAGGIGVNLSVISGYGTAKDPDELIQQDPKLWQECVEKHEPAVDWILKKYEESVDILTGPGKREYSDMAMRVIGFLSDPVEKRHYEKLVARRLDVSVEDLVAKKIPTEKRRLKPVKTTADGEKSDMLSSLVDRMEAILIYGGEAGKMIQLEEPTDETRKSELELVFNEKYGKFAQDALKLEAEELNKRYDIEMKRRKIEELTTELDNAADDDEKTAEILRQITTLRREMK
jgi:DNA primase